MTARKGHWPKGKGRHPDAGSWGPTLLSLVALLDEHYERGRISAGALAKAVGVADAKTVLRWIGPPHQRPSPEHQQMVAKWVAARRAEIESRRKRRSHD